MSTDTHPQSRQGLAIAAASATLTLAVGVTAAALLGIVKPSQAITTAAPTNQSTAAAPLAPQTVDVQPEPVAELAPDLGAPEVWERRRGHHDEDEHEHHDHHEHGEEHDDD